MDQPTHPFVPRQLTLTLDSVVLRGLSGTERAQVVTLLAQLLLEANSGTEKGGGDERA